jgi:hypothetical protein
VQGVLLALVADLTVNFAFQLVKVFFHKSQTVFPCLPYGCLDISSLVVDGLTDAILHK